MKVFIGSSSEAQGIALVLLDILSEINGVEVMPWWQSFRIGETTIEALHRINKEIDCAIMVFTEDDDIVYRGEAYKSTRDNTVFEYGLFSGTHGRNTVAIVSTGNPKILTDLSGLTVIKMKGDINNGSFKDVNTTKIKDWINQVGKTRLPKSLQLIAEKINRIPIDHPHLGNDQHEFESLVNNMLNSVLLNLMPVNYIDRNLIDSISHLILNHCKSIYAIDVIGPRGWINTMTFKYLAPQLTHYLRKNITSSLEWELILSDKVRSAIEIAIKNSHEIMSESLTIFDNPRDFKWQVGMYKFQFSRILLWSKEELLTPIAESVITIHEAFHVPLFFLETPIGDAKRKLDYILFENNDSGIDGFLGQAVNDFRTETINPNRVNRILSGYELLLQDKSIMFAIDAREKYLNKYRAI